MHCAYLNNFLIKVF
jgi:hypothetical protein